MNRGMSYTLKIDAEIQGLTSKLAESKKALHNLFKTGENPELEKQLSKMESKLAEIKATAKSPITSKNTFTTLNKDIQAIDTSCESLLTTIQSISNLASQEKISFLPKDEYKKITESAKAIEEYGKGIKSTIEKKSDFIAKEKELAKVEADLNKQQEKLKNAQAGSKSAGQKKAAASKQIFDTTGLKEIGAAKALLKKYEKQVTEADQKIVSTEAMYKQHNKGTIRPNQQTFDGIEYDLKADREQYELLAKKRDLLKDLVEAWKEADDQQKNFDKEAATANSRIESSTGSYEKLKSEVDDFTKSWNKANKAVQDKNFAQLKKTMSELGISIDDIDFADPEKGLKQLQQRIDSMSEESLSKFDAQLGKAKEAVQGVGNAAEGAHKSLDKNSASFEEANERSKKIDGITSRIKAFVGLQGAALLARRAMQAAFHTIKELDAQMTEMAVVTDLNISDYWNQLPEYTKRANDLGVSIKSAYEAATLYYQQGLKNEEVMDVSNNTLKMARIANLSAEDATNKMTAALRGFNMEVNKMNSQKVADVYSELAAITASDVKEISTAMTKTASLASNAGMEFETTAAFLSQIIETTRESAETAGTALKTIIARFQELKKDPSEIQAIDGEIVDANKIEGALRTVGVSLRDSTGQFRKLDKVFLELSTKWDTLDTNTQRYIATIAAGSRQQSRFIAMMSNHARTVELVNAAYNSNGASNEQFEKTLDSLETKLSQLKNAWDTFVMGLINNDLIKFVVDLLSNLLELLNFLTQGWDSISGTIIKVTLLTTALHLGSVAVNAYSKSIKDVNGSLGDMSVACKAAGNAVKEAVKKTFKTIRDQMAKFTLTSGKLILILAAITVAIIAIKAIVDHIHKNSPAGRLERATEISKRAAEEAEEAANAYTKLDKSLTSIGEHQTSLEKMTRGTEEWRAEVLKLNDEVLNLIDEYSELSQYARYENGQLKLDLSSVGVRNVLANAELAKNSSKISSINSAIYQSQAQQAFDLNSIEENRERSKWLYALTLFSPWLAVDTFVHNSNLESYYADQDRVATAGKYFMANPSASEQDFFNAMINNNGQSEDWAREMWDNKQAIIANTQALEKNNLAVEQQYGSMRYSILSGSDFESYRADELNQMSTLLSGKYMKELIKQQAQEYTEGDENSRLAARQKIASTGQYILSGDKLYKKDQNGDKGDELVFADDAELFERAAAIAATEFASIAAKKLPEALKGSKNNLFAKAFQDEKGGGLTFEEVKQLDRNAITEEYKNNPVWQEIYSTVQDFEDAINVFTDANKKERNRLEDLFQNLLPTNIKTNDVTNNLLESLLPMVTAISLNSGEEKAGEIFQQITQYFDNLNQEQRTILSSTLSSTDWSSLDSIELLKKTFREIGADIPNKELDDLITNLKDLSGAVQKLDFTKLQDKIIKLANLELDIGSGKQKRAFSKENYEALIGADINLMGSFAKDLSGNYVYLGNSMHDLQLVIEEANRIELEKGKKVLDNSIAAGEALSSFNTYGAIKGYNQYSDKSIAKENLKEIINWLSSQQIDLGAIQLNFSSDTVDKMQDAQLNNAYQILNSLINDLPSNKITRKNYVTSSIASSKLSVHAGYNQFDMIPFLVGGGNDQDATTAQGMRNALFVQGQSMGINNQLLTAYSKASEKLTEIERSKDKKGYDAAARNFLKISQQVADLVSSGQLNVNASATLSQLSELIERYNKSGDSFEKSRLSGLLVNSFGMKSNSGNYKGNAQLITELLGGSSDAFKTLVNQGLVDAGLGLYNFDNINGLDIATIKNDKELKEFIDLMINGGFGAIIGNKFYFETAQFLSMAKEIAKEVNSWINPYDWLYNLTEKINGNLRERNKLEQEYNLLLKQNQGTYSDLSEYLSKTIDSIQLEVNDETTKQAKAKAEINEILRQAPDLAASVKQRADGSIYIDEDRLSATVSGNADRGGAGEGLIDRITALRDTINSSQDKLYEAANTLLDLQQKNKDAYIALIDQTRNALINKRQTELDRLQSINDAINDGNERLVNKMQEKIDDDRQARENERTEEDIADKEQRLAYLQQDTSGANALEILQLQEDIASSKESYQDSLVDQAVQKLSDDNARAAEQREMQLAIMQDEFDYWKTYQVGKQAEDLVQQATSTNNTLIGERFKNLLMSNNIKELSQAEADAAVEKFNAGFNLAKAYSDGKLKQTFDDALLNIKNKIINGDSSNPNSNLVKIGEQTQELLNKWNKQFGEGEKGKNTDIDSLDEQQEQYINDILGYVNKQKKNNKVNYLGFEGQAEINGKQVQGSIRGSTTENGIKKYLFEGEPINGQIPGHTWLSENDPQLKSFQPILRDANANDLTSDKGTNENNNSEKEESKSRINQPAVGILHNGSYGTISRMGTIIDYKQDKYGQDNFLLEYSIPGNNKRRYKTWFSSDNISFIKEQPFFAPTFAKKFASGGLADFTGPAWLDGTKSSPELILNARDTQNFIQLKDILSSFLSHSNTSTLEERNNTYYNVDINVDSIDSDYDVDQMAERVKGLIEENAMYRNVNNVN